MSTISSPSLLVKCPHCSETFTPEDAIGHDIRIQLEKEFEKRLHATAKAVETRVAKQESDRYREKFLLLEEDRKIKAGRLQEYEKSALMIAERERQVKDREEGMEMEMKRRWLEREKLVREQADKFAHEKATLRIREEEQKIKYEREQMDVMLRKRVQQEAEKTRDEERMKQLELQKKLDDQTKLINEMKRKSEQGSMQMQGEVQELAIEEFLEFTFPRDQIEEISKGRRGGDCVHIVRDHYGNRCGSILYESKRTKHL
jgi:hypothetical protein